MTPLHAYRLAQTKRRKRIEDEFEGDERESAFALVDKVDSASIANSTAAVFTLLTVALALLTVFIFFAAPVLDWALTIFMCVLVAVSFVVVVVAQRKKRAIAWHIQYLLDSDKKWLRICERLLPLL